MIDYALSMQWGYKLAVTYFVSLGIGTALVEAMYRILNRYMETQDPETQDPRTGAVRRVPPWFTGVVERLVFTTAVIVQPNSVLTAMAAWLGLKMAANWNRAENARHRAILALVCGLASMFFAGIAGYAGRFLLQLDSVNSLLPVTP